MSKNIKKSNECDVMLDGTMTYSKLETGLRIGDFQNMDQVAMEPFSGKCRIQVMRNGNMYFTEEKRRIRRKPLFRLDHSSLSLGRDDYYYFVLRLPKAEVKKLPAVLQQESEQMALKAATMIIGKGGKK